MKLSIGTAQFGFNYGICNKKGIVKIKEVKKIFDYCKLKKIRSIDTAQGYGKSHEKLRSLKLKKFIITTKISNLSNNSEEKLSFKVDNILAELNVKKVYSLLIHNTKDLENKYGKTCFKFLEKLKKKKFDKLGVSVYTTKELNLILKNYKVDIVSIPISIANQEFCKKNYLYKLKKKGIEIHVRSVFLQGLLLSSYKNLPKKFKKNRFFLEWFKWLKLHKYDPLDASLGFIKNIKYIDKIVVGVNNVQQLKKIYISFKKELSFKFKKFNQSKILREPSKW